MIARGTIALLLLGGLAAAADKPDVVQGNWLGEWKGKGGMGGKNVAEIYGLGNGEYQATFTAYDSGEQDKGVFTFSIRGASVSDDKVVFTQNIDLGLLGSFSFEADVEQKKLLGKYSNGNRYQGTMELKRIEKTSDAIGAKPLPGAIALLDGQSLDNWDTVGKPADGWKIADGILVAPKSELSELPAEGHLATKASFNEAQIHVEFRVPYLPEKREQERGQGGVFLDGQYELQIVDSFGFPREKNFSGDYVDDDALGAILGQKPPTEQAALPPGEWQAFDITFRAAKRDAEGKFPRPAEVTVLLNGTQIHDRVELSKPTEGAPTLNRASRPGLILQNGGQAVEYRNIWYVPLDAPSLK